MTNMEKNFKIAVRLLNYSGNETMYLDGTSCPVFYPRHLFDRTVRSKCWCDVCATEYCSKVLNRAFTMASGSIAGALLNIAAGRAAVGFSSTGESVAELVCDDCVQYAVYNPSSGCFEACVFPNGQSYPVSYKVMSYADYEFMGKDYCSVALILSLLPFLMESEEFSTGYDKIMSRLSDIFASGKDISEEEAMSLTKELVIISDNADLRIRFDCLEDSIYIDYNNFYYSEPACRYLWLEDVQSGGRYFPVSTKIGKFSTL